MNSTSARIDEQRYAEWHEAAARHAALADWLALLALIALGIVWPGGG
jgi:hypothetical protein